MQPDSHESYKRRSKPVANEPHKNFCPFFLSPLSLARERGGSLVVQKLHVSVTGISLKFIFYFDFSLWKKRLWQSQTWWLISGVQFSLVPQVCKFKCVGTFVGFSGFHWIYSVTLCMSLNECPEEREPRFAGYQAEICKTPKLHTNLSVTLVCKTAKWICLRKPSLRTECRAGCT